SDGGNLYRTQTHQIDKRLYESASLRDAIAKSSEHALFECWIWFFLSESFFKNFVHGFGFLMSFSAGDAIDQVRVKHASFVLRKLAVQIGGRSVVVLVVNGCYTVC